MRSARGVHTVDTFIGHVNMCKIRAHNKHIHTYIINYIHTYIYITYNILSYILNVHMYIAEASAINKT